MAEIRRTADKDKHVLMLELKLPRWPLRKEYFARAFPDAKAVKNKTFDEDKFARAVAEVVSKYLTAQQSKSASRESGKAGGSTTKDTVARMSNPTAEEHCYFDGAKVELCYDSSSGEVYVCVCEYYKCDDCSWFKECYRIDIPWLV